MTEKEIIRKALDKATKNNPEFNNIDPWMNWDSYCCDGTCIIFSHDFAKAFWKTKKDRKLSENVWLVNWKSGLQQMVLEEDPIKYLEKFI